MNEKITKYGLVQLWCLFFVLLIMGAVPVAAQDVDLTTSGEIRISDSMVGVGLAVLPDYEGSNDYHAVPFVVARVVWEDGRYLALLGNTLRANLLTDERWSAGPMVRYRSGRDDVDDDRVDRMEDVDDALEVGAFAGLSIERWMFMLSLMQDVADGHDGFLAELRGKYALPLNDDLEMSFFATASYANEDYMDAYFSIDAEDSARSGLQTFSADGGLKDLGAGLTVKYELDSEWSLMGLVKYSRLLGDADDSPVVDDVGDPNQFLAGVLVGYRF